MHVVICLTNLASTHKNIGGRIISLVSDNNNFISQYMEENFVHGPAIASGKATKGQPQSGMQNNGTGKEADKTEDKAAKKVVYTHDQAVEESIQYFKGDELAARVWANKYALKDSFGNLYEKTPDDMHHRLAREIHRIEKKYINPSA